ncbi:54S ribosomal protein L12, mitochondrial [Ophidiomyces ophidiicola]|nr:54S ribosomal protein L12, mitochondrial [Ophidiomyces ophidiicola]KAI1941301.1 54S ribosomal protein L12, mitochondrial [Ophidiomyces ophidiicola]KAI1961066.1 54S ribosomal protein L12, mitochondrial [Ophidiomyces ophidiicola]
MALPLQISARCCRNALRQSPAVVRAAAPAYSASRARRWQSTDAAAAAAAPVNPKITQIVDQISQLTLLETADLVSSLKTRLNIPDLPVGGFAMPAGGPGGAGAAAAVEEDEPEPAAQEKTLFNLKLESFEATSKAKVIKEVKSLLGLSLVDSKKFVESVPKVMKESVPKEEAEKIVETLKALGAKAVME